MKTKLTSLITLILTFLSPALLADYQWSFSTSSNPSYSSGAHATVATGAFSSGWWDTFLGLQTSGFWDLGSSGTITLGVSGSAGDVTVETIEWIDGWIFGSYSAITFSGGATSTSESYELVEAHPSFFGAWMKRTQTFSASAFSTVTITGAVYGSLVESIHVY